MSDEDFFALTPRQYHMLLDKHERQLEHNEFLFGQLCATVANWSLGSPKEPLKATQFMPSQWAKAEPVRKKRVNHKALAAKVRALFNDVAVKANG